MSFPRKYILYVYVYMGSGQETKKHLFFFKAGSDKEAIKKAWHKIDSKLRNSRVEQQVLYRRGW